MCTLPQPLPHLCLSQCESGTPVSHTLVEIRARQHELHEGDLPRFLKEPAYFFSTREEELELRVERASKVKLQPEDYLEAAVSQSERVQLSELLAYSQAIYNIFFFLYI